jgi:hypothetical protein
MSPDDAAFFILKGIPGCQRLQAYRHEKQDNSLTSKEAHLDYPFDFQPPGLVHINPQYFTNGFGAGHLKSPVKREEG